METLSSCYFCGVAVDAAVEEYPLVDSSDLPEIETDQQIHLCPSCRRKLTTVIEEVLVAAFDDAEPAVAGTDPLGDVESADLMTPTSVSSMEERSEAGVAVSSGDDAGASNTETQSDDGGESPAEASERETGNDDETAEPDVDAQAWSTGADADPGGDDPSGEADTASGTDHSIEATDSESDAEPSRSETSDGESPGAADETDREYTKAEFNKIVRLLQNREFPVEIVELVVVAQSAYRIDESTCHAVIDALIERGVVLDEGDELVRP